MREIHPNLRQIASYRVSSFPGGDAGRLWEVSARAYIGYIQSTFAEHFGRPGRIVQPTPSGVLQRWALTGPIHENELMGLDLEFYSMPDGVLYETLFEQARWRSSPREKLEPLVTEGTNLIISEGHTVGTTWVPRQGWDLRAGLIAETYRYRCPTEKVPYQFLTFVPDHE